MSIGPGVMLIRICITNEHHSRTEVKKERILVEIIEIVLIKC